MRDWWVWAAVASAAARAPAKESVSTRSGKIAAVAMDMAATVAMDMAATVAMALVMVALVMVLRVMLAVVAAAGADTAVATVSSGSTVAEKLQAVAGAEEEAKAAEAAAARKPPDAHHPRYHRAVSVP